jgi:hypothetical protein
METTNKLSFASEASNCFHCPVAFFGTCIGYVATSARLTLSPQAPEAKLGFIVPFVARAVIGTVIHRQIDRITKK